MKVSCTNWVMVGLFGLLCHCTPSINHQNWRQELKNQRQREPLDYTYFLTQEKCRVLSPKKMEQWKKERNVPVGQLTTHFNMTVLVSWNIFCEQSEPSRKEKAKLAERALAQLLRKHYRTLGKRHTCMAMDGYLEVLRYQKRWTFLAHSSKQGLKVCPARSRYRSNILMRMGDYFFKKRDFNQAVRYYKQAMHMLKNVRQVKTYHFLKNYLLYRLGWTYLINRHAKSALVYFKAMEKGLTQEPHREWAWYTHFLYAVSSGKAHAQHLQAWKENRKTSSL